MVGFMNKLTNKTNLESFLQGVSGIFDSIANTLIVFNYKLILNDFEKHFFYISKGFKLTLKFEIRIFDEGL